MLDVIKSTNGNAFTSVNLIAWYLKVLFHPKYFVHVIVLLLVKIVSHLLISKITING
jgi:hypothetical protein